MSGVDDSILGADIATPDDLAFVLRQLRRRHARHHRDTELTYRELAARSGYARGVIGDYFTGKVLPSTDRLDVLLGLLGASGEEKRALASARDRLEELRREASVTARTRTAAKPPIFPSAQTTDRSHENTSQMQAAASETVSCEPVPGSAGDPQARHSGAAATRTLPRDIASFTGRDAELSWLMAEESRGGNAGMIHVIGGMPGVGKTTFAVHVAHRLAPLFPDGQIFMALRGHTPGQQPVDPADALASLLLTAGVSASCIPPGLDARARMWRDFLAGKRTLLLLDDASGHEQVRPLLPGTAGNMVLITSRKHLTALDDARAISLDVLAPDEAARLLVQLAARAGLRPDDPAVRQITGLCSCLPLAVAMLARKLHHHPAWTAAGLAIELAASRERRLELIHAENISVAAAFDLSYRDLDSGSQRMFRRLGMHPGTDIDAYSAAALTGASLVSARRDLEALYDQHLLTEPAPGRYRFHDLIRMHARTFAAAEPTAQCEAATERLLDYYLSALCAASRFVARRQPDVDVKAAVVMPVLADRTSAVTWLDTERLNLHSAADHAVASGRPAYAIAISGVLHGYLCSHGHWDQALALHQTALDAVHQSGDAPAEPRALTGLGIIQRLTGDASSASVSFARAFQASRDIGDGPGAAAALNELGVTQYVTGDPAALRSLSGAVDLFRELGDTSGEAAALNDLARAQLEAGDVETAASGLSRALDMHRSQGDAEWEANALDNLGTVQRLRGDYQAAAARHAEALAIFREHGGGIGEANALYNIGVVQHLTGDYPASAVSLSQALSLYQNLGNRSGEARTLSSIGDLDFAMAQTARAASRYEQALAIANDGAFPLEQARALEGIGRCSLQHGERTEGIRLLAQALAIYQRIRSPLARRVAATLETRRL
ncbi:MAG TPA: tetratricopeptide repeat protein [Streptosporangiaceae bacterium]|nr:tetratricopeptide repeat protein [Streptosporangiaceae bacterium]